MKQYLVILVFALLSWSTALQASPMPATVDNGDPIEIRIYPNPTTSYFEVNTTVDVQQVEVFNLLGRKMKAFDYGQSQFYDISDLPDGMYLVQLVDSKQNVVTTQRLQKR